MKYTSLDKRISETYAAKSTATNKNSLYDSYLRAFRWATDRIENQGIVAFVSNGGWIDGNTGDGIRLSLAEDFSDIYVFNLRGNQRTAGELSRKEGGKVFGSGSRSTIAITIGIKDPSKTEFRLHYRDIGDYLSADDKLKIVDSSSVETIEWTDVDPNVHGDWVNQRSEDFSSWPVIGAKKNASIKIFTSMSMGLGTSRDAWVYNASSQRLESNIKLHIKSFKLATEANVEKLNYVDFLRSFPEFSDPAKIKWSSSLTSRFDRNEKIDYNEEAVVTSLYRPFCKQLAYFDPALNHRISQLPSMFPTPRHRNVGYYALGIGATANFSILSTTLLPDVQMIGAGQNGVFFSRFTWEEVEPSDGGLFRKSGVVAGDDGEASIYGDVGEVVDGYRRVDNITDEIKKLYRDSLSSDISGDDIFHFVYGKLHDPEYRTKYAADLKKMLPHIETPATRAEFDKFAVAGKKLIDLHVNYEDAEPWPLTFKVNGDENDRETWRVIKLAWAKKKDPETGKNVNDVTTLKYNKRVTITDIPKEADEYMLGSRSALAWIIDRYQVKTDKASGIVNDPNDWADEVGNPRYIADLIGKVTRVAVDTVRIVKSLESE